MGHLILYVAWRIPLWCIQIFVLTTIYVNNIFSILLFSHQVVSDSLWSHELQHARLPCPSPSPCICSKWYELSQWCHPSMLFSVSPFSSCPQFFPASGSFPMSQLFTSNGQSIAASASASVLPMNIQDWFPLGLTGLISLFNILLSTNRNRFGPWCNWHIQLENSFSTEWISFILMRLMEFKWFWKVYVCTKKGQSGHFGYAYLLCSQQDHSDSRIRPISPASEGPVYNLSTGVDECSLFLPTT